MGVAHDTRAAPQRLMLLYHLENSVHRLPANLHIMPEPAHQIARRHVWTVLGAISLGLGVVGILVPLLPTTPFLILAAYLFSRGSHRLHAWLVNHQTLGPPIRHWRDHRAVSSRAKVSALLAIALIFALSVILDVSGWLLAVQTIVLGGVAAFLLTRPTPPGN